MRPNPGPIADALASGFIGIGDTQPVTRATVDTNWYLTPSEGLQGTRPTQKLPIRYWQKKDNATNFQESEMEIPNLKTCIINRGIQNQAGTLQLTIYNNITPPNGVAGDNPDVFGRPGFFSFARGTGPTAKARWGQEPNGWKDQLRENSLLRLYQGYGGADLPLGQAIAEGYVVLTGVFLVDNVQIESGGGGSGGGGSGGLITLNGRDMAKLLIDQTAWPPTIPQPFYTDAGIQYVYGASGVLDGVPGARNEIVNIPMSYLACSAHDTPTTAAGNGNVNDVPIIGHFPSAALSDSPSSCYVSEGFDSPDGLPWVEFQTNSGEQGVSAVQLAVPPGYQNCTVYVSIWGGLNNVFYSDTGWGVGAEGDVVNGIPYLFKFGVSNTPTWVNLPSGYATSTIRFTIGGLTLGQDGQYRASLYSTKIGVLESFGVDGSSGEVQGIQGGNYYDWSEIVADFCLWGGFWLQESVTGGETPKVWGVIENSGSWNTIGPMIGSQWDKNPLMDNIQTVAQVLGFIFRIAERGEVFFAPPNFFAPGNYDENNDYLGKVFPVLDEKVTLTDYIQTNSDQGLVSEIIVAPEDPYLFGGHPNNSSSTVGVTRFDCGAMLSYDGGKVGSLRGINKPAMIGTVLNVPVDLEDQNALAELLAVQCYLTMRQGQATAAFDPSITPDTQIKIYDRVTGECNIHYVTSVQTEHDIDQGNHLATYSTYWLGNEDNFVISNVANSYLAGSSLSDSVYNDDGVLISSTTIDFLARTGSSRVHQLVGTNKTSSLSVSPSNKYEADLNANAYGDTDLTPITAEMNCLPVLPAGYNARTDEDYGTTTNAGS